MLGGGQWHCLCFAIQSASGLPDLRLVGILCRGLIGYPGGHSNWTLVPTQAGLPATSGLLDLYLSPDSFAEAGRFFEGLQASYNFMLPDRFVVIGAEAHSIMRLCRRRLGLHVWGHGGMVPWVVDATCRCF